MPFSIIVGSALMISLRNETGSQSSFFVCVCVPCSISMAARQSAPWSTGSIWFLFFFCGTMIDLGERRWLGAYYFFFLPLIIFSFQRFRCHANGRSILGDSKPMVISLRNMCRFLVSAIEFNFDDTLELDVCRRNWTFSECHNFPPEKQFKKWPTRFNEPKKTQWNLKMPLKTQTNSLRPT